MEKKKKNRRKQKKNRRTIGNFVLRRGFIYLFSYFYFIHLHVFTSFLFFFAGGVGGGIYILPSKTKWSPISLPGNNALYFLLIMGALCTGNCSKIDLAQLAAIY